jgi:DNA-binding PadR family transcriptional regulator
MKTPKYLDMKGFLSFLILHELNKKRLCGDELSDIIGKRKGSKLTPGTIYPTLKRLNTLKLIRMKQDGRKKNYNLTKKGKNELKSTYKIFNKLFIGLKSKIKK